MVISTVAAQATTAVLVHKLTDRLLRSSADVLAKDYELLMQAACILCHDQRLKRSQVHQLFRAVLRQKEIVWAHCEDLKKERATLRKTLRKAFPRNPVVHSVKVYTRQTGRSHPVNGRLYQQLNGTPLPTTSNTPTPVTKSTKNSTAKKTELPFDNAEEGYKMNIEDTKEDEGDWEDGDDNSDNADEGYKEDGEENDEEDDGEEDKEYAHGEEGEEGDIDNDVEIEEDMD